MITIITVKVNVQGRRKSLWVCVEIKKWVDEWFFGKVRGGEKISSEGGKAFVKCRHPTGPMELGDGGAA